MGKDSFSLVDNNSLIARCNDQTHTGEIRLSTLSKAGGDKRKQCGVMPGQAKKDKHRQLNI